MLLLIPTIQVIAVGHACGTTRSSHSCCVELDQLVHNLHPTCCSIYKAENESTSSPCEFAIAWAPCPRLEAPSCYN